MSNTNIIDSSDVLNELDYETINFLKTIKKKLFYYIDMKEAVKLISLFIDRSNIVSFKSERAKKFIDVRHPSFSIEIDLNKVSRVPKFNNDAEEYKFYSDIIYDEIIKHFTDTIQIFVDKRQDEFEWLKDVKLFTNEVDDEVLETFKMISTIFGFRFNKHDSKNISAVVEIMF